MQIPYRKPGKYSQMKPDHFVTKAKLSELQKKLERLKKIQPEAAAEVARLAELGDFSENAEYQLAKGKLRGINNGILRLEHDIHQAVLITPQSNSAVAIGHTVTVEINGQTKTYHILGSTETDPTNGVISYLSPLGAILLGRCVGDCITHTVAGREKKYTILSIT